MFPKLILFMPNNEKPFIMLMYVMYHKIVAKVKSIIDTFAVLYITTIPLSFDGETHILGIATKLNIFLGPNYITVKPTMLRHTQILFHRRINN